MGKLLLKDKIAVAHVARIASEAYDYLYLKAEQLFAEYNPCDVRDGNCKNGRLRETKFCCWGCEHLGDNGCTVKSLCCKLWFCHISKLEDEFKKKRDALFDFASHG